MIQVSSSEERLVIFENFSGVIIERFYEDWIQRRCIITPF